MESLGRNFETCWGTSKPRPTQRRHGRGKPGSAGQDHSDYSAIVSESSVIQIDSFINFPDVTFVSMRNGRFKYLNVGQVSRIACQLLKGNDARCAP